MYSKFNIIDSYKNVWISVENSSEKVGSEITKKKKLVIIFMEY